MMKTGLRALAMIAILLSGALLVACSDDDDNGGTGATGGATGGGTGSTGAASTGAPQGGGTLTVASIDFGYEPAELTVSAGEQVTLEYNNEGELPHTFTIDDVVDSGNIGGGESTTLTFTADEPGELTFYCTIHGAASMSGTLIVE